MSRKRQQQTRAPRTAYDSMQLAVPMFGEVARRLGRELRDSSTFDSSETAGEEVLTKTDFSAYLGAHARAKVMAGWSQDAAIQDSNLLGVHLHYAVNYELHLRKTFWVDASLAWALHQTNLDIVGEVLRLPFPCCAFVFNDAASLEVAEGLLAYETGMPSGTTKVLTVYVLDAGQVGSGRSLSFFFCLDLFDGKWPYVVTRDLLIHDDMRLDDILASKHDDVDLENRDPIFDSDQMKAALHLAINAILYSTSADIEMRKVSSKVGELRARLPSLTGRARRKAEREVARLMNKSTGEDVFFLPGKIDIRRVEQLREVERSGGSQGGGTLMTRFMVRGHYRRPNPSWKDQRIRWIEPYWKGPELATVIEREYRLRE